MPFNWKTPLGYVIALMTQGVASYFTLLSTASTLCLLVGICLLLIAFVEDLANDLNVLSISELPNDRHSKLLEDFRNSMQLYSQVKQLSADYFFMMWHSNKQSYFYVVMLLDLSMSSICFISTSFLHSFYGH